MVNNICAVITILYRDACLITDQDTDTFITTGGSYSPQTVTRYDHLGFLEDLPSLNVGRKNHGCGAYLMENGTQALLVTGGYDIYTVGLSNTEIASTGSEWQLVNSLPRSLYGVRSVNIGGIIFITGGRDSVFDREEVHQWTGEDWVMVGKMKKGRNSHAVSTILLEEEVMKYCA